MVIVVMGVSGSGKSTIAALLAQRLGWDLAEGDTMHPAANVVKMSAGQPLDDADRWPWLAVVARWIDEHLAVGHPGVVTCSALKRSYRDVLRRDGVVFVYLDGTEGQIGARLATRTGHFMPASLLASQIESLERPGPDEAAITLAIGETPSEEVDEVVRRLGLSAAT